jgi:hypothetical protein
MQTDTPCPAQVLLLSFVKTLKPGAVAVAMELNSFHFGFDLLIES